MHLGHIFLILGLVSVIKVLAIADLSKMLALLSSLWLVFVEKVNIEVCYHFAAVVCPVLSGPYHLLSVFAHYSSSMMKTFDVCVCSHYHEDCCS